MNVALFCHRFPPARGGAEAYAARLVDHLRQAGDDVTVWTTSAVTLDEFWHGCPHGTNIQRELRRYQPVAFPLRRYLLKAMSLLSPPSLAGWSLPCNPVCPQMLRDVRRFDGPLDCVHALAFPYAWPLLCGLTLARRRGVPFHLTPFLHLNDARTARQYLQPALRWLLLQADRVFVQTRLERDAVLAVGVPHGRIALQGLGVETRECTGGDRFRARRDWHVDDTPVIGHLANLSFEKGTIDLLRAGELLWSNGGRLRLVLAGPEQPRFRKALNESRFQQHVTCLGEIDDDTKRDFYAGIDAFALPSKCDSFGLVLLEAWANGKPNVVYAQGGPGEIVRHGVDGLHARTGDVRDLAMQIHRLSVDAHLRRQFGDVGRARIPVEFQWAEKLEKVRGVMGAAAAKPIYARNAWESLTPRLS